MLLKWVEPRQVLPKERQRFENRGLFALILPILVEQLLTMLVGIADTLMVSYAGEAAVSGVSLVNQLNNVFIFVFGAVASGGAVVASQYIGGFDRDIRFVPVTAFVTFIWQGRTGCDESLPFLPDHISPVLSGAGNL